MLIKKRTRVFPLLGSFCSPVHTKMTISQVSQLRHDPSSYLIICQLSAICRFIFDVVNNKQLISSRQDRSLTIFSRKNNSNWKLKSYTLQRTLSTYIRNCESVLFISQVTEFSITNSSPSQKENHKVKISSGGRTIS